MQFLAIIVDSFRESRDRKIFWVMIGLSCLVASAMFCIGFDAKGVDLLFGAWRFETDYFVGNEGLRKDIIASWLVDGVMDTILGSVGVVLTIIATAGFIPSFLERGVVDVVIAKPMSRARLFLAKYLGSLVFIFVQAAVFVGLTWLVAGVRWHVWLNGYLLSIPLMVILFSYLYCISALAGVYYRSSLVAIILCLVAWVVFFGIQTSDDFLDIGGLTTFTSTPTRGSRPTETDWTRDGVWHQGIHIARWAIPKTADITYISRKWVRGASSSELIPTQDVESQSRVQYAALIEAKRQALPAWQTIGSSLAFEAVIVLIAMWKFSRTDF